MTAEQDEALMGNDVKMIGRWHDLTRGQGVAIFEPDNADALSRYALNWNRYMDIALVVDDRHPCQDFGVRESCPCLFRLHAQEENRTVTTCPS